MSSDTSPAGHCWHHGYEIATNEYEGVQREVAIHRLIMLAEYGFEAVCQNQVHHLNGVRWDNRPSNLSLMSASDHARLHSEETEFWKYSEQNKPATA
ncbi:HNH endonuclease [Halorubrum tailed phage 8]|uniref:HNH protein n=2 Tax=Haloferacalesvirus TaxID=2843389 RepID=R4T593_9CAUD|nr:HNH endonuclease [Halorubrum tailed phage 8]AGM10789.1 HNH protein [Halorubrum tailed phage 8]UBF19114.1 HNH endonuclease [Halorubrum phage HRTV-14]